MKEVSVENEHDPTPVIENDDEAEDDTQNEHDHNVEVEVNKKSVGATYEESFMKEVQQLGEKRQRKPPTRFDEECYIASDLTSDIDEPINIKDAFCGEHANEWKNAVRLNMIH